MMRTVSRMISERLWCVKLALIGCILLFWVTGIVMICVGGSVQLKLSNATILVAEASTGTPMALTSLGIVIFLLAALGSLAAVKESSILMKSFAGLLLLVFLIEVIVGLTTYSFRDKIQYSALESFWAALRKYGSEKRISGAVDGVQQRLQCCGARDYTDWFNISGIYQNWVPDSCCRTVHLKCGKGAAEHSEGLYQEGCVLKVKAWIMQNLDVVGGVGVGLGITQILGILLASFLAKILQEDYASVSGGT